MVRRSTKTQSAQNNRRDLWQLAAWIILLFLGITFNSNYYGLSSIPDVVGILLLLFVSLGLFWGWYVYRHGAIFLKTPLDGGMIAVLMALFLAAATSIDPSRSWHAVLNWSALIIIYYIAVSAFRMGWRVITFVKAFLLLLTAFLFFGYIDLALQIIRWYSEPVSQGFPPLFSFRVGGLINNPNAFAVLINIGLMLCLGYLAITKPRPRWPVIWLIFAAPMVMFHGSRNGWIAAVASAVSLLFFFALWRSKGRRIPFETWKRLALALVIGTALAILLVFLFRRSTLQSGVNLGTRYRLTYWQIALETWSQNPFIGQGPGTFASSYLQSISVPNNFLFINAHSLFMDALAEAGLIGLIALILLFFQVFWLSYRRLREGVWKPMTPAFLAALTSLLVFSLFDTPWIQQRLVGAILLAALIAQISPIESVHFDEGRWGNSLGWIWPVVWLLIVIGGALGWRAMGYHGEGISYGNEGKWLLAIDRFSSAQGLLPYQDTAYLLNNGFANGVVAKEDEAYLSAAISLYEQALVQEPGWSVNHANLAGLYWQAGDHAGAIREMKRAIELAPKVSLYHLNLGLWSEAEGQAGAATEAYRQLIDLQSLQSDHPFWYENQLRKGIWSSEHQSETKMPNSSTDLLTVYAALEDDSPLLALKLLQEIEQENRDNPSFYLAMGVTHLNLGDTTSAAESWHKALDLQGDSSQVLSLWMSVLPETPADDTNRVLAEILTHSIYGQGQADRNNYFRDVLVRQTLDGELLPQLNCFSLSPGMSQQLRLLRNWFAQDLNNGKANLIDSILRANKSGVTSCYFTDGIHY